MTEDQLRSALADYAEPLRYHPPVSQRRRFPVRPLAVGATILVAGFAVMGVLAPRPSSAAAVFQRMQAALTDAKTMRTEFTLVDPKTGKEVTPLYMKRWYDHGRWRIHARMGRFRESVVLLRDGRMYLYMPRKQVVTMEPLPPTDDWDFKGGSALDFAMNEVNLGQMNVPRQSRLEAGPKGTDRLILERAEDSYRCVIDVDRKTGLPIQARMTVTYRPDEGPQTSVFRFFFNEPADPAHFEPKAFKAPIVDLVKAQEDFRRAWKIPMATTHGVSIRDAAVSPDGTVFITFSRTKRALTMPDTLRDAKGTEYLRLYDMQPGGSRGDTNATKTTPYSGGDLMTTVWVPQEPMTRPASNVRIGLSRRSVDAAVALGTQPYLLDEVEVPLRPLKGDFPEYGTAFVLETFEDGLAVNAAGLRARAYAQKGDLESELRWLLTQVREQFKRVPRWGREAAEKLAKRYRDLGRESEAQEVERDFGLGSKAKLP